MWARGGLCDAAKLITRSDRPPQAFKRYRTKYPVPLGGWLGADSAGSPTDCQGRTLAQSCIDFVRTEAGVIYVKFGSCSKC